MLRAQHVAHSYGDAIAIREVDIEFREGRCALVGVNGAGKSTLLSILSGGLRPTGGSVLMGSDDIYSRRGRRSSLPKIALMPQALTVPGNLTAFEAVRYLAWMRGMSARLAARAARESLETVGLGNRLHSRMRELSGGMQRRVALAQALASSPDILLLDEPSTGLDPEQRRRMVEIISRIEGNVVFSSHVMEDVEDVSDRVVVIDAGTVLFDGSVAALKARAPAAAAEAKRAEGGFLTILATRSTT